jgi:hypothetical protein
MGHSVKFFWLDANDSVHAMTLARYEGIFRHRVAAPEFAGQVLRLVTAIVDMEERRVTQIMGVSGSLISFDVTGLPDEGTAKEALIATLPAPGYESQAAVIRYRYEYQFEVTDAQRVAIKRYLQRRR